MLSFEREVVSSLINPELGDRDRAAIAQYVDESLQSMPEYLRAGVLTESLLFGTYVGVGRALGRRRSLADQVDRWQKSSVDAIRQYVRLLQSLALFAEHELVDVKVAPAVALPTYGATAGAGRGTDQRTP